MLYYSQRFSIASRCRTGFEMTTPSLRAFLFVYFQVVSDWRAFQVWMPQAISAVLSCILAAMCIVYEVRIRREAKQHGHEPHPFGYDEHDPLLDERGGDAPIERVYSQSVNA